MNTLNCDNRRWSRVVGLCWLAAAVPLAKADDFTPPPLGQLDAHAGSGTLVICGGGKLPEAAVERLLEAAGGERARLVVIPTASARADGGDLDAFVQPWRERGFADIKVLHTRDRKVADTAEFVRPLQRATAVWFVGGQQKRLSAVYVGTRVESELYKLLERGGVIGGTSAGAAIQSQLMIAFGNPEATLMRGLDLVPGAVIDQHFRVRNRQPRLTAVLAAHPGYFGLGIDEDTALVRQGQTLEVVGESTVTICQSASPQRPATQYELAAGQTADLNHLRSEAQQRASGDDPANVSGARDIASGQPESWRRDRRSLRRAVQCWRRR